MDLPILVLHDIVVFPNTCVPMLVSDPHYVALIKEAMVLGRPIAIALSNTDAYKETILLPPCKVGTMAVPIILKENDDGSLKILIKGEKRIELMNIRQNLPFPIYSCQELPDIKERSSLELHNNQLERLKNILLHWVDQTIEDSIERENFLNSLHTIHQVLDYLCMFIVKDKRVRQLILENRSLHERIQVVSTILRNGAPYFSDKLVENAILDFEEQDNMYAICH